jgi:hypothetical protein
MVGPSQWSRSASAGGIPAWWSRRRNWSITTLTCTHAPPRLSRAASTGQATPRQATADGRCAEKWGHSLSCSNILAYIRQEQS